MRQLKQWLLENDANHLGEWKDGDIRFLMFSVNDHAFLVQIWRNPSSYHIYVPVDANINTE